MFMRCLLFFQITPILFATKDPHDVMKQLFYSHYTYHRRSLPRSLFLITIITILSVQYKEIPDKTIQENLLHYLQILDLILMPKVHVLVR